MASQPKGGGQAVFDFQPGRDLLERKNQQAFAVGACAVLPDNGVQAVLLVAGADA